MMMEAKKESYINQRLSSLHDGSKDENDTRDAAKVGGSVHHSSQEREESSSVADDSDSSQRLMADGEKKSKRRDFPSKLHEMLHDSKTQGREHIISWGPDGTSFKVHQPEDFVAEVMPKYFKQTKYRSFQRMVSAIVNSLASSDFR